MSFLFTSESVRQGHPDKVADQISDAILDACLEQDPNSRVACETLVAKDTVHIAGEITCSAKIDFEAIARNTIREIGYTDPQSIFSDTNCKVICTISEQSSEISECVTESKDEKTTLGAGDQGLMFGFACKESKEFMPLPIAFAHRLVESLDMPHKKIPYLRPDGKVQITIEYHDNVPKRIHTILMSVQHNEGISREILSKDLSQIIKDRLPESLLDDHTIFHFNPSGMFTIGGPEADCGLTGRKIIVDTYGGFSHHGGGAFSGKDCSKVDRSGAYIARYIAKNIVASGIATHCEVQIAYGIGMAKPISIHVNTMNTSSVSDRDIEVMIPKLFDLTPEGIINTLDLKKPIFRQTSHGGHFGRRLPGVKWENIDMSDAIQEFFLTKTQNFRLKNKHFHSTTL